MNERMRAMLEENDKRKDEMIARLEKEINNRFEASSKRKKEKETKKEERNLRPLSDFFGKGSN